MCRVEAMRPSRNCSQANSSGETAADNRDVADAVALHVTGRRTSLDGRANDGRAAAVSVQGCLDAGANVNLGRRRRTEFEQVSWQRTASFWLRVRA
ncbi:MAG: hypothetical protein JWL70_585 [Acidimicrobiia bacterium]|nr:hypothetical protein [Acidimicrobiia bacterium]